MSFAELSLGERIVLVAQLATDAHLKQLREEEAHYGRRAAAGGAGAWRVTDDHASPQQRRARQSCAPLAEGEAK